MPSSDCARPQPDIQRQDPTAKRPSTMTKEDARDEVLSPAESERVAGLSPEQLELIDTALLAQVSTNWRKVARIVGTAMLSMPSRPKGVPDVFFAKRVVLLVEAGRLESQGDLRRMGFSEVRLRSS